MFRLRQALGRAGEMRAERLSDTAEQVIISSLALIKMLRHARDGVPHEVMGLMLGEVVDRYTVTVVDVFAMPQLATGVSVEAMDPVYQQQMLDMLKLTARPEMAVGWYHSHPGFGCWLSAIDVGMQREFEMISDRAVAVVIDPLQSVRGRVVIDAFRTINRISVALGQEARQTTSNVGNLNRPTDQQRQRGLDRAYYSLIIKYEKNELEQKMLMKLNKKKCWDSLKLYSYIGHSEENQTDVTRLLALVTAYDKGLEAEQKLTKEQADVQYVGRQDPKRHLEETVTNILDNNILQGLRGMIDNEAFQ